jgi:hypothetical protein
MRDGTADLFGATFIAQEGDAVWTPDWCAADMVNYFQPDGRILEPCRGAGAFMRALPMDALWCEITDGRDFFEFWEPVDWIITNPPYSLMRQFLRHAFTISSNVVFLLPAKNVFSGYGTIRECAGWGGIAAIRWYGTGATLGFPMGNAISAIHWKQGHCGLIRESFYEDELLMRKHQELGTP